MKKLKKMIYDNLKLNSARARKNVCYATILAIQLRNGSRISEAIDFYLQVCKKFKKSGEVRVRKKKNLVLRKMVLPKFINKEVITVARSYSYGKNEVQLKTNLKNFARKKLGINTHSLRYAFITRLAELGYPPQIIANITKHSNLNLVQRYTDEYSATRVLDDLD